MALASAAPSYPALIGAVAIAGVGGSTYHPAGMSLISDVEADETAGKAMGVHELAGILGNMAAPVLIGGLAVLTDWRLALGATGAVGLGYAAVFALSWDHQPAPKPATESAGDGGVDEAPSPAAGVVTRLRHGVADLVRVPLAWWVLGLFLTKLLFTIQTYGVRTYLTAFVAARSGLAAGGANGIFFLFLAGSAVATVWFGALADRFSRLHLLAATFLAAAAAIAATAVVPASLAVFAVWFFVLGIAAYAALPVVNTLVSEYAEAEFSGSLFGIVQTASALGGTVSPVLFGEVASRFGIRTAFPAIAVVCLVAGVGFVVAAGRDG